MMSNLGFSGRRLMTVVSQHMKKRSLSASTFDVVIGGGGVMGSSVAFFLKKKDPKCKVCVIERDPTYEQSATTLSVASIRQQFSVPENVLMSMWSYEFLSDIARHLHVPGIDTPDIQFKKSGYLFLASEKGIHILKDNYNMQKAIGADVELLSPSQLSSEFKWLNMDGVKAGCIGREREGWFDPWSLLSSFKKKAVSMGVSYIHGSVENILCDGKKNVSMVQIKRNKGHEVENIHCGNFVSAAGPWAGSLVKCTGIDLPVTPRKRFVYVIDCPKEPARNMPLMIDPSGVYVRPEGSASLFLCGLSPEESEEPDTSNLDVDYNYFEDSIWPVLANRVPALEELKVQHSWAGYYDYNTFDQNAIIGPHPEFKNLFFANGFSGHGIQQSPAVGDAVSELILRGCYGAIDLSRFSFERLIKNLPLKEKNVV